MLRTTNQSWQSLVNKVRMEEVASGIESNFEIEDFNERVAAQKRRAERFGVEMKEVHFPGMVPESKRYMNTTINEKRVVPLDLVSVEDLEKRKKRFLDLTHQQWIKESFIMLQNVYLRQTQQPYDTSVSLPSLNMRIPSDTSIPRPNCLHLFAVDRLKTKNLFDFFAGFPPKFIEWLDESSCNAVFKDEATTSAALASLGFAFQKDDDLLDAPEVPVSQENSPPLEHTSPTIEIEDKEVEKAPPLDLTVWRVGKASTSPPTHIAMRKATLDDKRPDFETRLKQYKEKEAKKQNYRHNPYSRQPRAQKQRGKDQSSTKSSFEKPGAGTEDDASTERAKRFGGLISSILHNADTQ